MITRIRKPTLIERIYKMIKNVIQQKDSDTITVAQLKAMNPPPPCVFVVDEDKDKCYILAKPKAGFYLVNIFTGDVKWKPRATFAELMDKIASTNCELYVYENADDLCDLINENC